MYYFIKDGELYCKIYVNSQTGIKICDNACSLKLPL